MKHIRQLNQESILNSVNLKAGTDFPYLILDVVDQNSVPLNPGFRVLHWHEDFQFVVVHRGKIEIQTLDDSVVLTEGEAVFINKNVVHCVHQCGRCHYHSIIFPDYFLKFYFNFPGRTLVDSISANDALPFLKFEPTVPWQGEILERIQNLLKIKSDSEFYSYEVLVQLTALWLTLRKNISLPAAVNPHPLNDRMQQFLRYIALHYAEEISLGVLASSANVSKSECLRCFKISLQTTPYQYLIEFRLARAAELLCSTDLPVGEIAGQVGFHQVSHFGKCFKEKTGCTPKEYRKNNVLETKIIK
ncbi:helix-turn-helix domain-containing protein [Brotaphodocola sp.]|uniref:helix-turn-helix domain-containing protein n=1 Tax=Brotaphodocola sp. TaxID=3073577 RepID=UPI003D7E1833